MGDKVHAFGSMVDCLGNTNEVSDRNPNTLPKHIRMPGIISALMVITARASSPPLPLTILDAAEASRRGAVCLDGSPPGLYFRSATTAETNSSWVIFMKGGAWCTSPADCAARSRTNLGSSTKFPPTYSVGGPLDPDPMRNPTFAKFNHVILFYCDGASFAGDAIEPLHWTDPHNPANNATLYFRGRRVLKYMLDWLVENREWVGEEVS